MKAVAIIQARMGGSRLPGKMLAPIGGKPLLTHVFEAATKLQVDGVWLATTTQRADDVLVAWAAQYGIPAFRGLENDVHSRLLGCARRAEADWVVRLCGDCPLIDAELTNWLISTGHQVPAVYYTYITASGVPAIQTRIGLTGEFFTRNALEDEPYDAATKEHVTYHLYADGTFSVYAIPLPPEVEQLACAVDTVDDWQRVDRLMCLFKYRPHWRELAQTVAARPHLAGGAVAKQYDGCLYKPSEIASPTTRS